MAELDPFTRARLFRFIDEHRRREGTLPTLQDLERGGFAKALVNDAVRQGLLSELYVTLTSGSVVKGYKRRED